MTWWPIVVFKAQQRSWITARSTLWGHLVICDRIKDKECVLFFCKALINPNAFVHPRRNDHSMCLVSLIHRIMAFWKRTRSASCLSRFFAREVHSLVDSGLSFQRYRSTKSTAFIRKLGDAFVWIRGVRNCGSAWKAFYSSSWFNFFLSAFDKEHVRAAW